MTTARSRIAAIVPTYRRPAQLAALLKSLSDGTRRPDHVIVIDNDPLGSCSDDWPGDWNVQVIHAGLGLNLAGARNVGWRSTDADICLFIDDDNTVARETIQQLVDAALQPGIGLVAPVIFEASNPDRVWCAGVTRSMWTTKTTFMFRGTVGPLPSIPWATAEMPDAFAMPRQVLNSIAGFDESRFPFHYDEADLGARVRSRGLRTLVVPAATAWHSGGTASNPGLEMARAYELSGWHRVWRMAYARVFFHGTHSKGMQRLVALGVFIPVYAVVTGAASMLAARAGTRTRLIASMIGGLSAGYRAVLRAALDGTASDGGERT